MISIEMMDGRWTLRIADRFELFPDEELLMLIVMKLPQAIDCFLSCLMPLLLLGAAA
jgi:hypothetical protein